jgi:hypothetical protein
MLRRYFPIALAVCGIFFLSSCNGFFKNKKLGTGTMNNNAVPGGSNSEDMPDIKFDEEDHDFGRIKQGETLTYSYKFTNTGKSDLIINNCTASCGCTVPNWPREPIRPGESGYIDIRFDSSGKQNEVTKEVHVSTNAAPAMRTIKFHVFVEVPPKN